MISVAPFLKASRFKGSLLSKSFQCRGYCKDNIKVPINLIKELREKTKAGIQDCRTALIENGFDVKASEEWLIKMSKATVQKKQNRIVSEGVLASVTQHSKVSILEV